MRVPWDQMKDTATEPVRLKSSTTVPNIDLLDPEMCRTKPYQTLRSPFQMCRGTRIVVRTPLIIQLSANPGDGGQSFWDFSCQAHYIFSTSEWREGTERILWYAMCTLEATPLLTVAKSREIHQAAPWYEAASTSKRLVISYDLPTSLSDLHTKSPHWRAFWIGLLAKRCLTLCESNTARENPSFRLQRQNHLWIQQQLVNFPLPGFIQQETQVGAGAGHTANRLNRYPISLLPLSNPLLPFTVRSILLTFIST